MRFVHIECLNMWRASSANPQSSLLSMQISTALGQWTSKEEEEDEEEEEEEEEDDDDDHDDDHHDHNDDDNDKTLGSVRRHRNVSF